MFLTEDGFKLSFNADEIPTISVGIAEFKRFDSKVYKSHTGCWEWKNSRDKDGYGIFWFEGRNERAHRISVLMYKNMLVPKNLIALHSCDNPPCVNPNHLKIGTSSDNARDAFYKGRRKAPPGQKTGTIRMKNACKRGHDLTLADSVYYVFVSAKNRVQRACFECKKLRRKR